MHSELDKSVLLDLLGEFEKQLGRKIILVAAGGTAMTLLNLKSSTIDIDFTGPEKDIDEFNHIQKLVSHGYKIDTWPDGRIFMLQLPEDYLERSKKIETQLRKIDLRALHPIDIVLTKICRLNTRDRADIESCIKNYKLTREDMDRRARLVAETYAGKDDVYSDNLNSILYQFF
jgi:hypothetical protein